MAEEIKDEFEEFKNEGHTLTKKVFLTIFQNKEKNLWNFF